MAFHDQGGFQTDQDVNQHALLGGDEIDLRTGRCIARAKKCNAVRSHFQPPTCFQPAVCNRSAP